MSAEKSSVNLLLFQENVKVWIIKIGFNQSFVLGNNLHFFPGKVLSETAQFRLLLLSLLGELQLSVKKILYIFQTRFMEGVWSGVQYSRVEEPTWPGGGGGGGGWCRRTGER